MSDLINKNLPSLLVDIKPGIIDLGWGHPSPYLHPLEDIKEASHKLFSKGDRDSLQYGASQGYGPFLESLAQFLNYQPGYQTETQPQELFLTAGASQGLDLACTLFAKSGDLVFVEEPTYFVIEKIFREHNLDVKGVSTDQDGMVISDLREKLESGMIPKFIYAIPTFQNPTGFSMTVDRRKELIELAEEYGFYIFADEVYQLIYFDELPLPPMREFDEYNRVISFGSFSKILAPGMRTGWIHASEEIIDRFTSSALAFSGGGFNQFGSVLIKHVIDLGLMDKNTDLLRKVYSNRSSVMGNSLLGELGDSVKFTFPKGGFYYWLKFPEAFNTEKFLPECEELGVSYRPGNAFSESGKFGRYLRLTFTLYEEPDLTEGVARLGAAYKRVT